MQRTHTIVGGKLSKLTQWVEELQSGQYEQGNGYLKYKDKYCCLGVLCDAVLELPSTVTVGATGFFSGAHHSPLYQSLPEDVAIEYGLIERVTAEEDKAINNMIHRHRLLRGKSRQTALASLNDCGVPFYAIGMIIKLLGWDAHE